jgi:hypothetical protein
MYLPLDKILEQNRSTGGRLMTKGMNLLVLAGLILALILNSLFVIDEKEDGIVFPIW